MKLILVHGINQDGKSSQQIINEWSGAIKETSNGQEIVRRFDIEAPFYGDILAFGKDKAKGLGDISKKEADFKNQLAHEMALYMRDHGNDATQQVIERAYFEQSADQEKGFPHNIPFVKFANAVQKISPLRGKVAMRFLGQAYDYYSNSNMTEKVDDVVKSAILNAGECVVIAHSLGTIVSYRVLKDLGESTKVKRFVTLGSPLGLRSFRDMIGEDLNRPTGVKSWLNAFDPRDFVAMGIKLQDFYTNVDEEITDVKNTDSDPHTVSQEKGYLHDERVVKYIGS